MKMFLERFQKQDPNQCWKWKGEHGINGYGVFSIRQKRYVATRVVFKYVTGNDPGAFLVCHTCDNPWCINPDHLWLGTPTENQLDCNKKGRHAVGAASNSNTLTEEDVRNILQDTRSTRLVAEQYGVNRTRIAAIRRRQTWKHIQQEFIGDHRDIRRKNHRENVARGENHCFSILTAEQVTAIRKDERINRLIAEDYGVSRLTISAIKNGKSWKWLK